ncbi:hypothetical protein C7T94_14590 [Pedobacter yulinensis]|uniref:RNA polymerase sigma-70 factor n=1 Tax=Pedobacter yulinensis TaxID=2126353 RepID=A0A2T3HI31_9SPHI|nr:sigma-70 family RNA polymerase sigma factor [Pedobacter yulinensis]PST82041.1 hypothetical protein C7T94_14590 [Pedobacter yulinensis]
MDLALAIKYGDEAAFEQVYQQFRRKGYYYFLRKTNSAEDAKDLLQTTFLRLWQYRHIINPDFSIDNQLFYIARTVLIDHIRKANRQEEISLTVHAGLQRKEEENFQAMEFDVRRRVEVILGTMPELRSKVFRLHKIEGYSYKEIAQLLEISEKSVDNHLSKALRKLREDLSLPLFLILLFFK